MSRINGLAGEELVADYLINNGYSILARNFRSAYGEIDIIAKKRDVISFVEVKQRTVFRHDPTELVPYAKQQKIGATARCYIAHHYTERTSYQFDVALISQGTIMYLADAFRIDE